MHIPELHIPFFGHKKAADPAEQASQQQPSPRVLEENNAPWAATNSTMISNPDLQQHMVNNTPGNNKPSTAATEQLVDEVNAIANPVAATPVTTEVTQPTPLPQAAQAVEKKAA